MYSERINKQQNALYFIFKISVSSLTHADTICPTSESVGLGAPNQHGQQQTTSASENETNRISKTIFRLSQVSNV